MIYGALLGLLLAIDPAPVTAAIGVVVGMTMLKGVWGIAFRRTWIIGDASHYAKYLDRLKESGPIPRAPWLSYLVRVMTIWGGVGLIVYAFGRWVWLPRSWWGWCLAIYVGAGLLFSLRHLAAGKRGAAGPLVTFLATILLWPAVLYTESRR